MKAINPTRVLKVAHAFFPTGKGLAVNISDEITFIYKLHDDFAIWNTSQDFVANYGYIDSILNDSEILFGEGSSVCGEITDILGDLPDDVLAGIYLTVVGHNPYDDYLPSEFANTRKLILEYLNLKEAQDEIFGL